MQSQISSSRNHLNFLFKFTPNISLSFIYSTPNDYLSNVSIYQSHLVLSPTVSASHLFIPIFNLRLTTSQIIRTLRHTTIFIPTLTHKVPFTDHFSFCVNSPTNDFITRSVEYLLKPAKYCNVFLSSILDKSIL